MAEENKDIAPEMEDEDITTTPDGNDEDGDHGTPDVPTLEDYQKEKARREKAEKALVELKKNAKKQQEEPKGDYISRSELELEKFLDKNPDIADYRDDLAKYQKQGLSLKQAKILIENDDKTIANRKKLEQMNVTDGEGEPKKTVYTKAEVEKMSQSQYNQFREKQEKGLVSIKG